MHCSDLDLLLIQLPNLEEPPYLVGMASLGSYLKNNGIKVRSLICPSEIFRTNPDLLADPRTKKVFSNFSEFEPAEEGILSIAAGEILESIRRYKPKHVGFSLIFGNVSNSIFCAGRVKSSFPDLPILFGGPGATLKSHKNSLRAAASFIFHGDSEHSVLELLQGQKHFEKIDGLDWKSNSEWRVHTKKPYFEKLTELPLPDYSDFHDDPYAKKLFESVPLSLGRGCPFRCRFCSVRKYGIEYRQYSLESCLNFVESNVSEGRNNFYVHDPIVNGNPGWIRAFCKEIIDRKLKIFWGGNLRLARYLNEGDTLDLLFRSGFQSIITGLESGSPAVLSHMRKYAEVDIIDQIFEKIRMTQKKTDIKLNLQLIIGYPTETEEDFRLTLDFISRHRDVISNILSCSSFMIIPSENEEMMELINHSDLQLTFKTDSNWSTPFSSPDIRLDRMRRAEELFRTLKLPYRMFYGDRLEMIPQSERLSHLRKPITSVAEPTSAFL